jgi:hypothetical protein
MGEDSTVAPVGPAAWGDTELLLPDAAPARWRDLLTDRVVAASPRDDRRALRVSDVFAQVPLALLVEDPEGEG